MEKCMNIVAQEVSLGTGTLKVMVKDSIDIQGMKTIAGCKALQDQAAATSNAKVIDLIVAADCTITAKTNLHELAFGITGINKNFGTPINSQYPELIPGGSSSGSAAAIAPMMAQLSKVLLMSLAFRWFYFNNVNRPSWNRRARSTCL